MINPYYCWNNSLLIKLYIRFPFPPSSYTRLLSVNTCWNIHLLPIVLNKVAGRTVGETLNWNKSSKWKNVSSWKTFSMHILNENLICGSKQYHHLLIITRLYTTCLLESNVMDQHRFFGQYLSDYEIKCLHICWFVGKFYCISSIIEDDFYSMIYNWNLSPMNTDSMLGMGS